jgi:hypothetical protein
MVVSNPRSRPLVDPSLLEAMRTMSVRERLEQNDRMIATVMELRRAFAARKPDDPSR